MCKRFRRRLRCCCGSLADLFARLRPLTVPLLYMVSLPVLLGTLDRLLLIYSEVGNVSWVDRRYAEHPLLSALHLVPGAVFFLLVPLQFSGRLRAKMPALHRAIGYIFVVSAIVSGLAVLWMVIVFPAVGALLTQVVTFALVGCMLGAIAYAVGAARARKIAQHRKAMIWAFALGLTVSTARIFINLAEWGLGIEFVDSFTLASAMGLAVNLVVVWAVLYRGRYG